MANLIVRNITENLRAFLRRSAKRNNRTLNAEVIAILEQRKRTDTAIVSLNRLRKEIARKYPHQTDSVELIREVRDSR